MPRRYKSIPKNRRYRSRRVRATRRNRLVPLLAAAALFTVITGVIGSQLAKGVIAPVLSYFGIASTPAPQNLGVTTEQHEVTFFELSVWYLQAGAYANEENAQNAADELFAKGGAGYLLQTEDRTRVIVQAYRTEQEAKEIREQLAQSGLSTSIYHVEEIQQTIPLYLTQQQAQNLQKSMDCLLPAIEALFQASLSESEDQCKQSLKEAQTQLKEAQTFTEGWADSENEILKDYKDLIDQTISLCNSAQNSEGVDFTASVRQVLCHICDGYQQWKNAQN